ncbi:hypothetical protein RIB2604_01711040 [Aspergillus luchuensis]|uniref:Uncharacterized protein n=1 Tax=Aspergillus kawachii TaxID=1069201 RepID=A0A146FF11_ASPKA|nr:hypothetical protein RIB2604_01711040 [Aspergillus luchuensis]
MKSGPIFGRTVTEVCYIHQYGWYCMQSLTAEETCQILLEKMLGYVSSVSKVDSLFSSSAMPSVESYWQRRERTAAVYCVICTFPLLTKQSTSFAYGFNITRAHVENEHMSRMWKHTSYLVHM